MTSQELISHLELRLKHGDSLTTLVQDLHSLLLGAGIASSWRDCGNTSEVLALTKRIQALIGWRDAEKATKERLSGHLQEAHRILTDEFGISDSPQGPGSGTVPERLQELVKKWRELQAPLVSLETVAQKPAEEPVPGSPVYFVYYRELGGPWYRHVDRNTRQEEWNSFFCASEAAWHLVKAGVCYEANLGL
jgi:hypothetical protein